MTGTGKVLHTILLRWPALSFYVATLIFGWGAYALVVGPELARGGAMQPQDAWILFPILVLSVGALGVLFSALARDRTESLWSRARRWRIDARWYLLLALPPVVIFLVLRGFAAWRSPEYAPGFFVWGLAIGVFPGFVEELGWSGYLLPRLRQRLPPLASAVLLGLLWAIWHLPVLNFMGAASPHGAAFPAFFVAFTGVLVAMRVVMVFAYEHTHSVLLMQLLHASSTGSLVLLSPAHVDAAGEARWYATYALVLGAIALFTVGRMRSTRP